MKIFWNTHIKSVKSTLRTKIKTILGFQYVNSGAARNDVKVVIWSLSSLRDTSMLSSRQPLVNNKKCKHYPVHSLTRWPPEILMLLYGQSILKNNWLRKIENQVLLKCKVCFRPSFQRFLWLTSYSVQNARLPDITLYIYSALQKAAFCFQQDLSSKFT